MPLRWETCSCGMPGSPCLRRRGLVSNGCGSCKCRSLLAKIRFGAGATGLQAHHWKTPQGRPWNSQGVSHFIGDIVVRGQPFWKCAQHLTVRLRASARVCASSVLAAAKAPLRLFRTPGSLLRQAHRPRAAEEGQKPLDQKVQGTSPVQWNLTQPFCSCEQHQSFLESDQPCIQLENPASQS